MNPGKPAPSISVIVAATRETGVRVGSKRKVRYVREVVASPFARVAECPGDVQRR